MIYYFLNLTLNMKELEKLGIDIRFMIKNTDEADLYYFK